MTLREFIQQWTQHPQFFLLFFGGLPLLALLGFLLPKPLRYSTGTRWVYSLGLHLSSVPGMFALSLLAYSLFFTHENLLDVNAMAYFLPPLSMGLTLFFIRQQIPLSLVPGFDRLSGLMGLMGLSFLALLLLNKLFVGIFFGGSIVQFLMLGFGGYLLLRWFWSKFIGSKKSNPYNLRI